MKTIAVGDGGKLMKKSQILPIAVAIILSANSFADEIYKQEKTVVTASRYKQTENDIIPSVTIIDRDDILNLQANSILDVLVHQQGIDVARNGGIGTTTSVFMRGTNSNHTLVLVDGVRVGSAYTGSFAWENLPVSQIERIEIVRGTRVSYYGTDAIGGVINIITRKQDNLYIGYTGGSFDSHKFDIGYGQSFENSRYSLAIGSQKTDGFSATNENSFVYYPDNEGYENLSVNLNTSIDVRDGQLSLNYLETKSDIDFDSSLESERVGANSDASDRVVRLAWDAQLFGDWDSQIALATNKNSLATKIFSSYYNSERMNFDWLLNKEFNNHHLGFGLNYQKEHASHGSSLVNILNYSDSRNNYAAFVNWRATFNRNILSLTGRYDNNSAYGGDSSADLDWAFQATDNLRLNVSYGSAFHAPNLNELIAPSFQTFIYSPVIDGFINVFSFQGNPDLKPEKSINYETGLKAKLTNNQDLSFNLFYYKIDNLIDYVGNHYQPTNINQATIKGLEVNYDLKYDSLTLNINTTVQDAKNDDLDAHLLRRPDNKINLNIDKTFNDFSIGSSVRYASKNYDYGTELDGHTVLDLRAAYKINENWKVSARIENATDEKYQIIDGYNTAKASGYLTIQWQQ